jgi:hypothetical protein
LAKGIASKNSLKALAHPIQRYLLGWGAQERAVPAGGLNAELPAPYALAALRGEGILRERFFGSFMAKLPVQLDPGQQISLWHELVEEGGLITEWVQRLGVVKALRREAVVSLDIGKESRTLYTLLLDVLQTQSSELLPWAVDGYFWHCWKARFPSAAADGDQTKKTADVAVLRERLTRALRRRHNEVVEVKESFVQADDKVSFALLVKRKSVGKWEELVSLERPRLKTARLAGYEAALEQASGLIPASI